MLILVFFHELSLHMILQRLSHQEACVTLSFPEKCIFFLINLDMVIIIIIVSVITLVVIKC